MKLMALKLPEQSGKEGDFVDNSWNIFHSIVGDVTDLSAFSLCGNPVTLK